MARSLSGIPGILSISRMYLIRRPGRTGGCFDELTSGNNDTAVCSPSIGGNATDPTRRPHGPAQCGRLARCQRSAATTLPLYLQDSGELAQVNRTTVLRKKTSYNNKLYGDYMAILRAVSVIGLRFALSWEVAGNCVFKVGAGLGERPAAIRRVGASDDHRCGANLRDGTSRPTARDAAGASASSQLDVRVRPIRRATTLIRAATVRKRFHVFAAHSRTFAPSRSRLGQPIIRWVTKHSRHVRCALIADGGVRRKRVWQG